MIAKRRFMVAGRSEKDPGKVQLRPRTNFNALGTLTVDDPD